MNTLVKYLNYLADLRIDLPLTIGYFLSRVREEGEQACRCLSRLMLGPAAILNCCLHGVITTLMGISKASIAIAVFLALSGPAKADAYSYDEIVSMVRAEEKVFGAANHQVSLDQRLQELELRVIGYKQSGSDSYRLRSICKRLGLQSSQGQIAAPVEVTINAAAPQAATHTQPQETMPPPAPDFKRASKPLLQKHAAAPLKRNSDSNLTASSQGFSAAKAAEAEPSINTQASRKGRKPLAEQTPLSVPSGPHRTASAIEPAKEPAQETESPLAAALNGQQESGRIEPAAGQLSELEKAPDSRSAFGVALAFGVLAIISLCCGLVFFLLFKGSELSPANLKRRNSIYFDEQDALDSFETYKEAHSRRPTPLAEMEANFHLQQAPVAADSPVFIAADEFALQELSPPDSMHYCDFELADSELFPEPKPSKPQHFHFDQIMEELSNGTQVEPSEPETAAVWLPEPPIADANTIAEFSEDKSGILSISDLSNQLLFLNSDLFASVFAEAGSNQNNEPYSQEFTPVPEWPKLELAPQVQPSLITIADFKAKRSKFMYNSNSTAQIDCSSPDEEACKSPGQETYRFLAQLLIEAAEQNFLHKSDSTSLDTMSIALIDQNQILRNLFSEKTVA